MSAVFLVSMPSEARQRLEQAYAHLRSQGCVKSRSEMLVKSIYAILRGELDCSKTLGKSLWELEKEQKEKNKEVRR